MRSLPAFFRRLDKTRARAVLVSLLLFALVLSIFVIGKSGSLYDIEAVRSAMADVATGPWGLPALILVFIVAAFLGVPQFVLIGIAVFAFGPILGFVYSWVATLVSGTVTFWTGRFVGENAVRRHGGNFANRMSVFIGRNAFAASAIVRNVPTGPFLLVNMIFGVTRARFSHYIAGMAVGVLPKIALVAFAGTSIMSAFEGQPLVAAGAALLAIGIWLALVLFARSRIRGNEQDLPQEADSTVDTHNEQAK
ncbi:MAG: VTT domain-containing protein [Hyphomonadaceae bacterium]|nr:VTT domain-containing protein [Hyphomonadaceae bacterium]